MNYNLCLFSICLPFICLFNLDNIQAQNTLNLFKPLYKHIPLGKVSRFSGIYLGLFAVHLLSPQRSLWIM